MFLAGCEDDGIAFVDVDRSFARALDADPSGDDEQPLRA
jgi:hypothetical protein